MANPFDQFDAPPAGNPFDKFDGKPQPPALTPGRAAGIGAQGFNDAIANTAGIPVDVAAWLLRQTGAGEFRAPIGGGESIKGAFDYIGTLPSRVGDVVSQGALSPLVSKDRPASVSSLVTGQRQPYSSRYTPQGATERAIYGGGEALGSMAGVAAPASVIAKGAGAVPTVMQRIAAALAEQPGLQAGAAAAGGAVGGATESPMLGLAATAAVPVAGSVVRRAVTPFPATMSPEEQRIAQEAIRAGIPLTPAQMTGNTTLTNIEAGLAKLPFSGAMADKRTDAQRAAFNRMALAPAGIKADRASPQVLDQAATDFSARFDDLVNRTGLVPADQGLAQAVRNVATRYERRLPTDQKPVFQSYIDDINTMTTAPGNPAMTGAQYQDIRSGMTTRARTMPDETTRAAIVDLRNAVDDAAMRANPGLKSEWDNVRQDYANYKTIAAAMKAAAGADTVSGNVPLRGLSAAVKKGPGDSYVTGAGELNDAARIGQFLAPRIPDSGTAGRMAYGNMLTGGVAAGAGATMDPTVMALTAGGIVTPAILQKIIQSDWGRAYLANQALANVNGMSPGAFSSLATQKAIDQIEGQRR